VTRALGRLVVAAVLAGGAGIAVAAAFPATLRVPRRDPGKAPGVPPALFSHRSHGSLGCQACHPAIFPQALVGFTHEEMKAGRFCGACHDGSAAFAIAGAACGGCHAPGR
jgi:c(7)-type cytochrome triheme protein